MGIFPRLALLSALTVIVTACGDNSSPGLEGLPGDGAGRWTTQRLAAEAGTDQAPLLASAGQDALVLTVSEDGVIRSHLSADGAPFAAGEPLTTGVGSLQLNDVVALPGGAWFTLGSGGVVEKDGDNEPGFEPVAFRSAEGLSWERVQVSGFSDSVDINDLAVVDGTVIAAGAYRTAADPAVGGGFEAHLWVSTDAASFAQVDLPGVHQPLTHGDESHAGHLVVAGDRLLAAGRVGRSATVWASDGDVGTWQRVTDHELDAAYDISGLAVVDDVVLAAVVGAPVAALRSTDGGATWEPVGALSLDGEAEGWAPLWADRSWFWTLTGIDDTSWSRPEVCYADLGQCGQGPGPRLVSSRNGLAWTAVALPDEVDEITGTADGRVLAVGTLRDGVAVHTLPAGTTPATAPAAPEPRTVALVTLEEGHQPKVGVRYHAPMYLHCGMTWFWFGDATWRRTDDGVDVETGAGDDLPASWPISGQVLYGHAVLVDADRLEYSVHDEVIATYRRAADAPGCD